ncbi:MAG: hypothetical protein JXR63_05695 [Spirochaetales bacterium]|nr:hypothetical protein [Spirochaetales bacterium]
MSKFLFMFSVVSLFALSCCTEDQSFASREAEGSAKRVVASFFDFVNAGEYEKSLGLFKDDPVAAGEITMDFYKQYVDENISKGKSIKSIDLSDDKVDGEINQVNIEIDIDYKDGSEAEKWVIVEKVGDVWKMTTRGSLF